MNAMRALYHLGLADFYERARRYRFLLTLGAVVYLGVMVNSGTLFMSLAPGHPLESGAFAYRGEFNSAWIGTMIVLVTNTFLGLFGFYLVNDCIERDIRTGVGQIIATTPVSRATYLAGKWISNFAVLCVLELILAAAAAVMVLLKHQAALDPGALLMPFFAVALPFMALIAAVAVVFETVPWLRGAVGNALYFFVWISSIMFVMGSMMLGMELPFLKDPYGLTVFLGSLQAAAGAAFPNDSIGVMSIGNFAYTFKVFPWSGLAWTPGIVGTQWLWAALGLGLILLSAAWFARFDPSREGLRRLWVRSAEANGGEPAGSQRNALPIALAGLAALVSRLAQRLDLSPLVSRLAQGSPFLGVLFAELRMLVNGRRWWWWLLIAGSSIAVFAAPLEWARSYLLPLAWLWPLPVWSEMGNRERKQNTYQMVFASARPVLRQLPAAWLAGVLATALIEIAGAAFFLSHGDLPGLAGWAAAVVFVPTLALGLGVSSSGSRAFEVAYVIWWYAGPLQKVQGLDFTSHVPQVYLLAAAGLLLLSAFWRGRQVRVA